VRPPPAEIFCQSSTLSTSNFFAKIVQTNSLGDSTFLYAAYSVMDEFLCFNISSLVKQSKAKQKKFRRRRRRNISLNHSDICS